MNDFERQTASASSRPGRRRSRRAAGPAETHGSNAAQPPTGGQRGNAHGSAGSPGKGDNGTSGAPKRTGSAQGKADPGHGPAEGRSRRRRRRGRGRGSGARAQAGAAGDGITTGDGTSKAGAGDARTGSAEQQKLNGQQRKHNRSGSGRSGGRARGQGAKGQGQKGQAQKQGQKQGQRHGGRGGQQRGQGARGGTRKSTARGPHASLRTVRETSAGGMVVRGLTELAAAYAEKGDALDLASVSALEVALIGRLDRRGRMLWSMPKGHVEGTETFAQTARREVLEETGLNGTILAELGSIDYWFVADGKRIHKTVHHHIIRYDDGDLCDEDPEITEVAWVAFKLLPMRLAYTDERRLMDTARDLLPELAAAEVAGRNPAPRPAEPVDPHRRSAGREENPARPTSASGSTQGQHAGKNHGAGADTPRGGGGEGRKRSRRRRGRGGRGRGGQQGAHGQNQHGQRSRGSHGNRHNQNTSGSHAGPSGTSGASGTPGQPGRGDNSRGSGQ